MTTEKLKQVRDALAESLSNTWQDQARKVEIENILATLNSIIAGEDNTAECIHGIHPNQCVDCNIKCKSCGGDGIERCDNPDHGMLNALSFRGANESACPCCGHDEKYRMRHWDKTVNKYVWNKCPDCIPAAPKHGGEV